MQSRFKAALFCLAFFATTSAIGQSSSLVFRTALTGANVVGAVGSATGFGSAMLTIDGDQATIDLTTLGLTNITGVSLFQGAAGVNGSLVQAFTDINFFVVNGRFHRTVTLDSGVAAAIAANPQNYYLAVATTANPGGAVRGQLNDANTVYLAGTISGTSPVCAGGTGIPNGAGSFVFAVTPDPGGSTATVRYDIVTRGLGATLSALQIGAVKTGPGLFVIGANVTSADGRFTGTNQISAEHARLMQTLQVGARFTVTTPATGIECAAAGAMQFAQELFIPVAGTVRGIGGTNFMTDVNILNNSSTGTNADVLTQYFPTGGSTAASAATSWSTLLPRGTGTYRDISATAFNGITGIGALRVVSADNIFANARIYNNLSATGGGTFGQFIPALPRSLALTEGSLLGLANIVSGSNTPAGAANARTNIGVFNPSETATTMLLELRDGNGALAGQRRLTLLPWMQLQMPLSGANGLFNNIAGDLPASSVYFLSGAPVFVYASVIDNPSGDASYVTPGVSGNGTVGTVQ
ncbi:MAG TPA: CHRD domain-containing protein [Thermoanaerobaculia bacterium]|jgi:hypothetical protein|nr:CHRD domain-containing protein [Thermoanaerobaculia bacterium]